MVFNALRRWPNDKYIIGPPTILKLYSARHAAAERCDQPRGLLVTYRLQYCSARFTDLNARRKTIKAKAPSPSKINIIQKRKSELVITLGWIST